MILVIIYIVAMLAANFSAYAFGPVFSLVNAFLFIGLDLTIRDRLHDNWNGSIWKMAALISTSSLISFAVNPATGQIALASLVAFATSSVLDWIAYSGLKMKPAFMRVNGSNVVGAMADSIIFPTIAFGAFMPWIVAGQFAAKVGGGMIWYFVIRKFR